MGGIAGIVSLDGRTSPPRAPLMRMLAAIAHRGAHGAATYTGRGALLGQCLTVPVSPWGRAQDCPLPIDLLASDGFLPIGAAQPESAGSRPLPSGESLLRLLGTAGNDAFRTLKAPFSIAWVDRRSNTLTLARDAAGGKSLFYACAEGRLLFCSELGGLLASGLIDYEPDPQAIVDYLGLGYVPAPMTAVKRVRKLAPGESLSLVRGEIALRQWNERPHPNGGELAAQNGFESLEAVLTRAVSPHPVAVQGVLMSRCVAGGTLAALCGRSGPTRAFSLSYGAETHGDWRWVDRIPGVLHERVILNQSEFRQMLPVALASLDEPIFDLSAAGLHVLAGAASAKVHDAITDGGADAVFGHDGTLYAAWMLQGVARYQRSVPRGLRDAAVAVTSGRSKYWLSMLSRPVDRLPALLGVHFPTLRGDSESLLRQPHPSPWRPHQRHIEHAYGKVAHADPVDQMLLVSLSGWLGEAVAVGTDRMTMAHGLATRLPYLDRDWVAALVAQSPGKARTHPYPLATRALLREVLHGCVPRSALLRADKNLLQPPDAWLDGQRGWLRQHVLDGGGIGDLFDLRAVERLLRQPTGARRRQAWSIAILRLWDERMRALARAGKQPGALREVA